jgi:NAD-dependent oxidoreductase involved in siderophore biosynthesis
MDAATYYKWFKRRQVSRLLPLLRIATAKQAQAIWREAHSLGIGDQLESAYRKIPVDTAVSPVHHTHMEERPNPIVIRPRRGSEVERIWNEVLRHNGKIGQIIHQLAENAKEKQND